MPLRVLIGMFLPLVMVGAASCAGSDSSQPRATRSLSSTSGSAARSASTSESRSTSGSASPSGSACTLGPKLVPTCGVLWGIHPGAASPGADLAAATAASEAAAGRPFDVVHTYHDFSGEGSNGRFPDAADVAVVKSGHILHIGWSTSLYGQEPGFVPWADIAAGKYDDRIDATAARLVAFEHGHPGVGYFLDFDHEPDGRDRSGTAGEYQAAARRVHNRLADAGVRNAVWVWVMENVVTDAAPFYPGDRYVDWIGYDPYNWVSCDGHSDPWKSFAETVTPTYDALLAADWHGPKPLMLAEYGSVEGPGDHDKADWFGGLPTALSSLPELRAVDYFDDSGQTAGCGWAVSSSPQSQQAFADAGKAVVRVEH